MPADDALPWILGGGAAAATLYFWQRGRSKAERTGASAPPGQPSSTAPSRGASTSRTSEPLPGRWVWPVGVWNHRKPEKEKPLERHLLDLVRRRVFAAWKRARELPHLSIDDLGIDDEAPGREEMERALHERAPDAKTAASVRDDIAELYRRAADDPDVLALIRARLGEC